MHPGPEPDRCTWERDAFEAGARAVAGVDEVGRGALAGPLVAAAVILPGELLDLAAADPFWHEIRDSKVIRPGIREVLAEEILVRAEDVSIAAVSVTELDDLGLAAANRIAMERAVFGLRTEPDLLLVDAMTLDLEYQQIGLIDGDALSISIAAASIVAKVHRDQIMRDLDAEIPGYGFARHKGYGVMRHLEALRELGVTAHHRRCFAPISRLIASTPHVT